jgi:hypothetical protein
VALLPEVLCKFRIHDESTTSRNTTDAAFRKSLDLPMVLHAFLFDPRYAGFRTAIGESGVEQLRHFAGKLVRSAATQAHGDAESGDSRVFSGFLARCPGFADMPNPPSTPKRGGLRRAARRLLRR